MCRKGLILCILIVCSSLSLWADGTLRIVSYNVENLFDHCHDTLKQDFEFTPEGDRHWTYRRYQAKVERIAQVLVSIGGWQDTILFGADVPSVPALVGLCEVENDRCLRSLCWQLRRYHYRYIHYESPDARGIDVALLYDSTHIRILHSEPLHIDLPSDATRDILYAQGVVLAPDTSPSADTLHLFVCHLPSQLGGAAATAWKRQAAKRVLQSHIDSLLTDRPQARIVVMGDMNAEPLNDIMGMTNLMCSHRLSPPRPKKFPIPPTRNTHLHQDNVETTSGANQADDSMASSRNLDCSTSAVDIHKIEIVSSYSPKQTSPYYIFGTHKYDGIWSYLDQFYISCSLKGCVSVSVFAPDWLLEPDTKYLGVKPKRTFIGYRYQDAYSDHLPIVLQITL